MDSKINNGLRKRRFETKGEPMSERQKKYYKRYVRRLKKEKRIEYRLRKKQENRYERLNKTIRKLSERINKLPNIEKVKNSEEYLKTEKLLLMKKQEIIKHLKEDELADKKTNRMIKNGDLEDISIQNLDTNKIKNVDWI